MTRPRNNLALPPPQLALTIQYACDGEALPSRAQLRRWVKAALTDALRSATVTIRLVDCDEGRTLNREFRGRGSQAKDYATNVLSFPYASAPHLEGDLVLCLPVVLREATEQKKPVAHHFAHLVIHGLLHLQGHDHETETEAEIMEQHERVLLKRFRIPDPYHPA
ncbi:MAG: rRNA maturation RNase YbeY [Sterolibacterium sp.]|jgi:probable rRNA maturation factor|nr:rRNA maturation RNase YbeY [Sterolibacterium sp.]